MSRKLSFCAVALVLAATAGADGGPSPIHSTVGFVDPGAAGALIYVVPSGTGPALSDARLLVVCDPPSGTVVESVNASIVLTLRDYSSLLIWNYPAEDMWLQGEGGNFDWCVGGTNADQNTNLDGQTFWVNPLRAGGCVESGVRIYIAGQPMAAVLNLIIASPDNNGDLAVTLIDLTAFAAAYNTPASYSTCHDYNYDCVVSLTDLTIFALYYNISTCL